MDAKPRLSLRQICVALLKMLEMSSVFCCVQVMVPLREMGSLEHKADGKGLGTGVRTCHMSAAIWEADWELV